jgi:hypothetical protein
MKRHPGTFGAGLLFIAIGVAYLLEALEVWQVRIGRLWPIALIVVGLVVLIAGRSEDDEPPTGDDPSVDRP